MATPPPQRPQFVQPPVLPRIDPAILRPRRAWYALPVAIGLIGIAVGVFLFVSLFTTIAEDFEEFNAPGQIVVQLDSGEEKTIYVQRRREDLTPGPDPSWPAIACRVTGPGGPVETSDASNFTIEQTEDEYRARLDFTAGDGGAYTVACRDADRPAAPVRVAVGPHIGLGGLVAYIVGGLAAMFIGVLLAIGAGIVIGVMRSRHKKRIRAEQLGGGGIAGLGGTGPGAGGLGGTGPGGTGLGAT